MTFLIFKVKLYITNMLPSWMIQLTFGWDKVGTIIVKTVHVIEKETYSEESETIDVCLSNGFQSYRTRNNLMFSIMLF